MLLMKKPAFQYFICRAVGDQPTRHRKILQKLLTFDKNFRVQKWELMNIEHPTISEILYYLSIKSNLDQKFQGQPMDVSEIKWLSIWCTRWTSYRGTIVIYDIYIIREIYITWHILMIIVSQISPISDSPSTWPRFFFLRIQRLQYELTTVATMEL